MSQSTKENELLRASLAGNKEAFGTVVRRYQSLICAITYTATGDISRSEELAQETFLRAWKNLRQLKDPGKFRVWLCTIARNLVRKTIRKRQSDVMHRAQSINKAQDIETSVPGPSDAAINWEQQAVVWRALKNIPLRYREPLVLFYREEQSVSQVAAGLGLSEQVVRQRLSRGRKLLKAEVASLVGDVLKQTRPSKVFAVAVVAALPAVSAQAAAAAVAGATAKGAPAAKAALAGGLSGAILGPILGLLGGILGAWMSIKNTRSQRERKFMVKIALIAFGEVLLLFLIIGLFGFLALKGVVPKKVYWWFFSIFMTVHVILLLPAILWANRRQRQIQKEDGTFIEPNKQQVKMTKGNIYGAFGGSIFGCVAWIFVLAFTVRDWITAAIVAVTAGVIFFISTQKCLRYPKRYWRIAIWTAVVLCALNLAVVNLRWTEWMELYRQSAHYNPANDISLWQIDLAIGAIFSCLLVLLIVISRKHKNARKETSNQDIKE